MTLQIGEEVTVLVSRGKEKSWVNGTITERKENVHDHIRVGGYCFLCDLYPPMYKVMCIDDAGISFEDNVPQTRIRRIIKN